MIVLNKQSFNYIMVRTNYICCEMIAMPDLFKTNTLN